MKNLTFVLLLLSGTAVCQQTVIEGYITELNSGRKPVQNVLIKVAAPVQAMTTISNTTGHFTLRLQDLQPGTPITIIAEKKGWVVINDKELNTFIPVNADLNRFKILMCPAEKLERMRKEYYEITDRYIAKEYKKKLAAIDRAKAGWQQKVKQLDSQLTQLRNQLTEIANGYSYANLDDLDMIELQVIAAFKAGHITEAIRLKERFYKNTSVGRVFSKKQKLDSIIQVHTHNLKSMAREYLLQHNYEAAGNMYEALVAADTTNFDNLFLLARFYREQNKFQSAINTYEMAMRHHAAGDDILGDIQAGLGAMYRHEQNPDAAQAAYKKAADYYEKTFTQPLCVAEQKYCSALLLACELQKEKHAAGNDVIAQWQESVMAIIEKWPVSAEKDFYNVWLRRRLD